MRHLRSWQSGGSEAKSGSLAAAVARHLLQGEILSQRNLFKFAVRAIYFSGVTVIRELWLAALP